MPQLLRLEDNEGSVVAVDIEEDVVMLTIDGNHQAYLSVDDARLLAAFLTDSANTLEESMSNTRGRA